MVVANFAKDPEGRFLGQTAPRVAQSMHHTFSELWLAVAGAEVHAATNFPNEYRPLSACVKPFEDQSSPVYQAGLRLLSGTTEVIECPFHAEWCAGNAGTDAATYARKFQTSRRPSSAATPHAAPPEPRQANRACPSFPPNTRSAYGRYAVDFVPTTRTWSNSTFVSGAMATGVSQAAADEMVDEMFQLYAARVAAAPTEHAMDYVHSYLHMAKAPA